MVHWDVLEDCLVGSKGERGRDGGRPRGEQEGDQSATTKPPTSDVDTPHGASSVLGSRGCSAGLKDPGKALTAPKQQAGAPSDQKRDASTTVRMQTVSQDTQTTTLGTQPTQPESTSTQTTISGEQLSTQLDQAGPMAAGTLLPTAQGFEIPLDADPRDASHLQELALPSGSSSAYAYNAYKCYIGDGRGSQADWAAQTPLCCPEGAGGPARSHQIRLDRTGEAAPAPPGGRWELWEACGGCLKCWVWSSLCSEPGP